ncbi:energy transducer TonB [Dokdonella sp.]|uniref:energy transducer TonB n=1 Tax=Dokdonella sp. TaxID=2291710 RepID=UPI003528495B
MAIRALQSISQFRCNWLRVSGVSATLFVHVLALVMLAIPVAVPSYGPSLAAPSLIWIEAPPEPEVFPVPDEPVPLQRPQVQPVEVAAPVSEPEVGVDSVASEPVVQVSTASDATAIEPENAVPAQTENTGLAYESIVRPKYPLASIRRGEHGSVLLRVTVGRDGLPREAEIARSSGFYRLDKAAREAVLRWRFRPVRVDGIAVQATGLVPIEFDPSRL